MIFNDLPQKERLELYQEIHDKNGTNDKMIWH